MNNHREGSIKFHIYRYLEGKNWTFGGTLCRAIHEICGSKEGVIEKKCRELAIEGLLQRRYVQQDKDGLWVETDSGHGFVQYRKCITPSLPLKTASIQASFDRELSTVKGLH